MKISKIHAALTSDHNPQSYLGPNYKVVLNFWLWLDSFKLEDYQKLSAIHHSYDYDRNCDLDLYVSQQGLDYVEIRNAVYDVVPFVNK